MHTAGSGASTHFEYAVPAIAGRVASDAINPANKHDFRIPATLPEGAPGSKLQSGQHSGTRVC